jgi:aminoglycoside adenylyltransferase-like protein/uncharacterized protein DUF5655/nucleotidyltransferase-like protein
VPSLPAPFDRIAPAFVDDLRSTLGAGLVGAYLYGSAVDGGFDPSTSDLDVVVVTARPTDELEFGVLAGLIDRLQEREPDWAGRLDIVFVGHETLANFRAGGPLVEISHDEPLRRLPDASQYLETWFLMRAADRSLLGPPASSLLPRIDTQEFLRTIAADIDGFISRLEPNDAPGKVAYRVLTVCRIARSLASGAVCTKREGAEWAANRYPEWADLIRAAWDVRAAEGERNFTPAARGDVPGFLQFMSREIRRDAASTPAYASIQAVEPGTGPDPSVDATGRPALWTCPRCGHRFVSPNLWHSCSRHSVDEHFVRARPEVRAAFDRLVELYERCGPIVVLSQKTRIVFAVRTHIGACHVKRDRVSTNVSLPRRHEHPRWTGIEQLGRWFLHHYDVRDPSDLDDPQLHALICESYHQMGEQGRLARPDLSG